MLLPLELSANRALDLPMGTHSQFWFLHKGIN